MSNQSSRGKEWNALRLFVLDRDGWQCVYCGAHLEGADATADHIIPVEHGGKDEATNLVAACRTCNGRKQDKIIERVLWLHADLFEGFHV